MNPNDILFRDACRSDDRNNREGDLSMNSGLWRSLEDGEAGKDGASPRSTKGAAFIVIKVKPTREPKQ